MNPTALRFIREYEHGVYEGAKYARQYGDLQRLYDASSDEFFIEEINDAYEEFKRSLV
ncbi:MULTISPECIES: hypothetical protein [Acinetobacter]|uniref:hypothetical protein n=1 Tax=Acinetobacter TaxID=469 RepID=UPI00041A66E9|nr:MULTISPECIES: hypothetical protein [Acinetobacter]EHZ6829845.1 hypothetical protein [Acinetobacter baumannii]EHZ7898558.1 hypothetical protein [Acinetobacter baumannii]EII5854289.1 hypothetical protein [Acinetobacter baumannii]EIR6157931.1 hypothetical protein [Acinetobacter baumannii]EIR6368151.1 hypothetical protein [Acinetobacter baumannii]